MPTIAILAVENCMQSSIVGPLDIFRMASLEWRKQAPDRNPDLFELRIITVSGAPVTCFNGMSITPHGDKDDCGRPDILFIPVIYGDLAPILSDSALMHWISTQSHQGTLICAVCAGVFLVAEAGLLNGKAATTHWHLADRFQARYPEVRLKREKMIVDEGAIITAGGVTAYMDLSLYLTGRFGSPQLGKTLSQTLLVDPARHSQLPYTAMDLNMAHGDEVICKVQRWMQQNLAATISISHLAEMAGLGLRTFTRRFKRTTGDTPLKYLQQLRIDTARTLLETTDQGVDAITYGSGYADPSSFRRLFKRRTGLSPSAYRKRFGIYPWQR